MARRVEYFDAAGLRRDGRRANELRECAYIIGGAAASTAGLLASSSLSTASTALQQAETKKNKGADDNNDDCAEQQQKQQQLDLHMFLTSSSLGAGTADGCAELVSASSHVRALVFGPRHAQNRDSRPDSAHFSCDVTALRRRGGGAARRQRSLELSTLVTEALSPVLLLSQYPLSTIHVHVDVLRSDGDEEVACINAASVALANACIAMRDVVVAVQVCLLEGKTIVVDPTFEELRGGCPRWVEAVCAHRPGVIVLLHEEGRHTKKGEQEEEIKAAMHSACAVACAASAKRVLDCMREHTNAQLAVLEGSG